MRRMIKIINTILIKVIQTVLAIGLSMGFARAVIFLNESGWLVEVVVLFSFIALLSFIEALYISREQQELEETKSVQQNAK